MVERGGPGAERAAGEGWRHYRLAAAELGAVSAQTVMVALLPVLLAERGATPLLIGVAIGGEGVFALLVPFLAGALSDRVRPGLARRFGRRMVVAAPAAACLAAAVAASPFLGGFWGIAAAAFVSFAALHALLTPFWALLLEDVPGDERGRVQGIRVVFRSAGLAYGLVAAGLLFAIWRPLPFLFASALLLATVGVTWVATRRSGEHTPRPRTPLRAAWEGVARNPAALWLLAADAFWNASVDGIRPYFFLYARETLGLRVAQTSVGLAVLVAVLAVASWYAGRLGDRHDPSRLLELASVGLAVAFALGFFVRAVPLVLVVAALAGAGAAPIMTLPLPLFSSLLRGQSTGESTGIYEVSVTLGRVVAPLLVGGVVGLAARWGVPGRGYPAMWLVAAALAAAGGLCAWRSRRARSSGRARSADAGLPPGVRSPGASP